MIDDFRRPSRSESRPVRLDDLTPRDEQNMAEPAEPEFKTPEEVAKAESNNDNPTFAEPDSDKIHTSDGTFDRPSHTASSRFAWLDIRDWSKKQKLIAAFVAVVVIGGGVAAALALPKHAPPVQKTVVIPKAAPKVIPKPIVSSLTGLPVTADQQKLPVTAVMVENSPDARPQSGLKDAGVVFEAIAEGGITRFMALFQEQMPGNIGPIRSSRPYYLEWALGFDAAYAHVGGSPDALADIKSWGVRDLDQFYNSGAYHRVSSRYAPHNVYTSRQALLDLQNSKGYTTSTYTGFVRKAEAPSKTPNASSINFAISGYYYNVHYDYDATANAYKRSEGGAPHMDAESNTQLEPKVVVALVMPYSLMADGYHSQYNTIGNGKAYFFQDGTVTIGNWTKPNDKTNFTFTDDTGKPIALNPGQTWITAVSTATNVTYQ